MRAGCSRVTHPCAGRRQKYCYPRAAPRLACVRPAASVHPEPGSNSSLYISYFSKLNPRTLISFKEINALEFVFGTLLVLLLPVLSMNFRFHPETLSRLISSRPGASQVPRGISSAPLSERDCKGTAFSRTSKFFCTFFHIFSPAQNRRGLPRGVDAGTMDWTTEESGAGRTDSPRRDFISRGGAGMTAEQVRRVSGGPAGVTVRPE